MIEVLVAIVVLAIGLLGLAGLQANGIKVNQGSTFRWKASELAADLSDQLRSGKQAFNNPPQNPPTYAAAGPCTLTATNGLGGTCPAGFLATSLPQWAAVQLAALPGAVAAFSSDANGLWQIDVAWDDTRATQIGAAPPQAAVCGNTGVPTSGCFQLKTQL